MPFTREFSRPARKSERSDPASVAAYEVRRQGIRCRSVRVFPAGWNVGCHPRQGAVTRLVGRELQVCRTASGQLRNRRARRRRLALSGHDGFRRPPCGRHRAIGVESAPERAGVGQAIAAVRCRGKSGLLRTGRQVTPGGREPTESATENKPPASAGKGEKVR